MDLAWCGVMRTWFWNYGLRYEKSVESKKYMSEIQSVENEEIGQHLDVVKIDEVL